MRTTLRPLLSLVAAGSAVLGLAVAGPGTAAPPISGVGAADPTTSPIGKAPRGGPDAVLDGYLRDTWKSFVAMTDDRTGLPADNVGGGLEATSRSRFTSPTNIGAYLWSTVVARDTGLIGRDEARERLQQTIDSIAKLEKHEQSGQYYNWYDPQTLEKLTTWPEPPHNPVHPFVSSVDNGWLATGLLIASRADSAVAEQADALRSKMDFGFYYDVSAGVPREPGGPVGGQITGGFWVDPPPGCSQPLNFRGGAPVYHTCHRYGAFNTEPRMASYLGIAAGQIPAKHYFGTMRTFPPSCDWSWTETRASGEWATHQGVDVFEGTLPYRGMDIVPTWGGSMFEALMVPLFVPEETWGARSWGVNHPLFVQGQIEHGKEETGYGYWGFSPSNNPDGGYREYGVDALGMDGAGYTSDQERTDWDQPYEGCPDRAGEAAPTADDYGDGVVTPHASFLALRYAKGPALANLAKLRRNFDAYGPGGFYDAVAVESGQVSKRYLSLDQGMIMAALGNALDGDALRDYVSEGELADRVRPLMAEEVFSAAGR